MADYKLLMPKMGESVTEATILHWNKKIGDHIARDEIVLEVATDKVDSDVPSPVSGILKDILHQEGDTVDVGKVLAIVDSPDEFDQPDIPIEDSTEPSIDAVVIEGSEDVTVVEAATPKEEEAPDEPKTEEISKTLVNPGSDRSGSAYYSPLVLNIAQTESIPLSELETISGSGKGGRVTKEDILFYVKQRKSGAVQQAPISAPISGQPVQITKQPAPNLQRNDEIIEMDRMRKLIAHHMIDSKRTSAHVSSFVEADLTNVVRWREKHKDAFLQREGFKLTYMPIFVEAIVNAIIEFPMINVSVDGDKIIRKKDINIGIATALPSGNLIVPVIKQADQKNLVGIAREMNDIIVRARNKALRPDDTQGGTYTISNVGTFGNIFGTPIINQPQVAIMAVGAIVKKPAVIETTQGDMIGIRHKMYLSHTYDHRVVDGMLGGMFIKRVGDYLENWNVNREF